MINYEFLVFPDIFEAPKIHRVSYDSRLPGDSGARCFVSSFDIIGLPGSEG